MNIAELKDHLHRVRAGEDIVIRAETLPIAPIVPPDSEDLDPEELSLVASIAETETGLPTVLGDGRPR